MTNICYLQYCIDLNGYYVYTTMYIATHVPYVTRGGRKLVNTAHTKNLINSVVHTIRNMV